MLIQDPDKLFWPFEKKVGTFYFCSVVLDKCLKIKLLSKVMSIETSPSSIPQPRFLGKFVISLCCNMFMR